MKRCRGCRVPLEGFGLRVAQTFFGVRPSGDDPNLCNKCEIKSATYKCEICERYIDKDKALTHVKAEEYIINLIKKDHPQWSKEEGFCAECLDYYRKLVREAEL
jgi:hypothetical protein